MGCELHSALTCLYSLSNLYSKGCELQLIVRLLNSECFHRLRIALALKVGIQLLLRAGLVQQNIPYATKLHPLQLNQAKGGLGPMPWIAGLDSPRPWLPLGLTDASSWC
jgi:hypothetical protein